LKISSQRISITKSKKSRLKIDKFAKLVKSSKTFSKKTSWIPLPKIKILLTNTSPATSTMIWNNNLTSKIFFPTSTIHSHKLMNAFVPRQPKICKYPKEHRSVTAVRENVTQTVYGAQKERTNNMSVHYVLDVSAFQIVRWSKCCLAVICAKLRRTK
jgi:hypothetical protein